MVLVRSILRLSLERWFQRVMLVSLAGLMHLAAPSRAWADPAAPVAMTAEHWETAGPVSFDASIRTPGGEMLVSDKGTARLRGADFSDGTIEFDVKPKNGGIEGIKFRVVGRETADALYFRAQSQCEVSDDCIQYMPQHHSAYEWDLYPEYQTRAPLRADGWNHVKLVISGRRMNAYLNSAAAPTLAVGRLEGNALQGGISLTGPATYANFKITTDVDHLPRNPLPDPTASDRHLIRSWEVVGPINIPTVLDPVYKVPTGVAPSLSQMPSVSANWKVIQAERRGLVNLSRAYGSSRDGAVVSMAWLKTSIISDRRQVKSVSMGWLREAWVFLNGRQIFADRNLYGTPASKGPDGSLSLQNGTFRLPLKKGKNAIVVALDDNFSGGQHFGWGMEFRMKDLGGLRIANAQHRATNAVEAQPTGMEKGGRRPNAPAVANTTVRAAVAETRRRAEG